PPSVVRVNALDRGVGQRQLGGRARPRSRSPVTFVPGLRRRSRRELGDGWIRRLSRHTHVAGSYTAGTAVRTSWRPGCYRRGTGHTFTPSTVSPGTPTRSSIELSTPRPRKDRGACPTGRLASLPVWRESR